MYKLYDYECIFGHIEEHLVEGDEVVRCKRCMVVAKMLLIKDPHHPRFIPMVRIPSIGGSAERAMINPAKTREMFAKAQEMRNKVQGRTPWRKSSYSQTGNE